MTGFAEIILHRRPIETFVTAGLLGPGRPIQHIHSLRPARVPLPPLETGQHFLANWQLRELPDQGLWRQDHYDSIAPPIFVVHDALVHSSAGIVALIGDQAIAETMAHTAPESHGYRSLAKGIAIRAGTIKRLAGTHISLLTGGEQNYFHSMLLSLARLASVPENYQAAAAGLLVPRGGSKQLEALTLLDPMPSLQIQSGGAGRNVDGRNADPAAFGVRR